MFNPNRRGRREHALPENHPHMTIEYDHEETVTADVVDDGTIILCGERPTAWIKGTAGAVET